MQEAPQDESLEDNTLLVEPSQLGEGFTQIPNAVLRDGTISRDSRLLYGLLLSYAWHQGHCFPGYAALSEMMGCTEKLVRKYMRELQDVGLVRQRRRGLGRTNIYYLSLWVQQQAPPQNRRKSPNQERAHGTVQERAHVPVAERAHGTVKAYPVEHTQVEHTQAAQVPGTETATTPPDESPPLPLEDGCTFKDVFAAVLEVCGIHHKLTADEGRNIGGVAKQLVQAGYSAQDVHTMARNWPLHMSPECHLTPTALKKWAGTIIEPPPTRASPQRAPARNGRPPQQSIDDFRAGLERVTDMLAQGGTHFGTG